MIYVVQPGHLRFFVIGAGYSAVGVFRITFRETR
jgi:hypothetical protein